MAGPGLREFVIVTNRRFRTNYKFPAKGVYHFYIEQNMRDNPLREVSDVGLRVPLPLGQFIV